MKLEKRLYDLIKDLLSPGGPNISTNRNYPFAIFQYSPRQEFIMRANHLSIFGTKLYDLRHLLRQFDMDQSNYRSYFPADLFC